ncbi:MAG: GGDEF domain-containing protein [Acetobacteraceae bacterium]|jgi:diguanylate cyclase (GGDEF)-like protein|nr:GGDEF domain-containing protein [Acetobacteraceae bacterium]
MPLDTSMPRLRHERGEATPLHALSLLAEASRAIPDEARRKALVARAEEIARAAGRLIRGQSARIRMLEHLVVTDPLTGLVNRRGLGQRLAERLSEARRHNEPGVVLFADVDGLKRINARFGHAAGNAAIRMVAEGLRNAVRVHDTVGRIGGDEFAVLMGRIDHEKGLAAAARIGRAIGRLTLVQDGCAVPLAISVGLAPFTGAETADELLDRADSAMQREERAALPAE